MLTRQLLLEGVHLHFFLNISQIYMPVHFNRPLEQSFLISNVYRFLF